LGRDEDLLEKLAKNICITNQLFCDSCQGVFLDTDDMRDVYDFCEKFLPVLERVSRENPLASDAGGKTVHPGSGARFKSSIFYQIQGCNFNGKTELSKN